MLLFDRNTIGCIEQETNLGKVRAKIRKHSGILRTLSRKQEGEISFGIESFSPEVRPSGIANGSTFGIR